MDSDLEFENVIFNDRNRHQANLMRCCASPEDFLVEIKALLAPGGELHTTETEPLKKWDFYFIRKRFISLGMVAGFVSCEIVLCEDLGSATHESISNNSDFHIGWCGAICNQY